jgi:hypothetical protein
LQRRRLGLMEVVVTFWDSVLLVYGLVEIVVCRLIAIGVGTRIRVKL